MLKRIWRSIVRFFQGLFGKKTPERTEPTAESKQPLEDADYEFLFMQLLEGVHKGWGKVQVLNYLDNLSDRASEVEWVGWLRQFGDRLLTNPTPNDELASRMLKLGETRCGTLADVAAEVARQLLAKKVTLPSPPMTAEAESLFYQGNEQFDAGNYQEAIGCWDQALSIKPDLYEAWANRALALSNLGRNEEAVASYDRALEIQPEYDIAWSNRGVALKNLNRYEEALASYDRALEIQPHFYDPWLNRGTLLGALKRYDEAIASYEKAVAIEPLRHDAWLWRGNILMVTERYNDAIGNWHQVLKLRPNLPRAWTQQAIALFHLGRYQEAIASCDEALKLQPGDPEALSYRNKSLVKLSAADDNS